MDCCLSNHRIRAPQPLPCTVKPAPTSHRLSNFCFNSLKSSELRRTGGSFSCRRSLSVLSGPSHCDSSSLNTPLVPRSAPGKYLSRVLQNQRQLFHVAAAEELKQLADDRDAAVARMILSAGSVEASLHRRIAELKDSDSKTAIEDVMYMLILFNFSEIKVHLVPKLSSCVYNGRLEIWPAGDWALEYVHSPDVLEMVKKHVYAVTGLTSDSSVTDHWAITQVQRCQLCDIYTASILYGYFLQSASTRHHLEHMLSLSRPDRGILRLQSRPSKIWNNVVFGHNHKTESTTPLASDQQSIMSRGKLSCYVMGFDSETLQRCAKVKSKEAADLIEKQTFALFGDVNNTVSEVIVTSFSSLKRLVLEGVCFGSFLWGAEEYVDSVYKLRTN